MRGLKRKSVIFSWLISYFVVSITALIVNEVSYQSLEKSILAKHNSYNIELLNNVKISADSVHQNAMSIAMRIADNPYLPKAASYSNINGEVMEAMMNVKQALNAELNTDMYIEDVYIYLHKSDYIIGVNSGNKMEKYFRTYGNYIGTDEEARKILKSKHYLDVIQASSDAEKIKSDVLIMNSVYGVTFDDPIATVVVHIDYTKFMKNNSLLNDSVGFCILKNNGELLVTNNVNEYKDYNFADIADADEGGNVNITREKVMIKTHSEDSGCYIVRTYSHEEYMGEIIKVRILMIVVLLLYVVFCGIMIYYAIEKNYAPIKALMDYVGKHIGISRNDKENEFHYIYNSLSGIIDKSSESYNKLDAWSKVVKNNVIAKLFKNIKLQNNTDMELYDSFYNSFEDKNYVVIACVCDISNGIFPDEEQGNSDDYDREYMARFIINNILDEQLASYTREFAEVDGVLYMIVGSSKPEPLKSICSVLEKFPDTIKDYFCFDTTFIISNEHKSVQSLPMAYNEVMAGMNYQFIIDSRIIKYSELYENDYNIYSFPFEKETYLVNSLREMNYTKTMTVINEVFDENIRVNQISVLAARCLVYNLVGTIISVMNRSDVFKHDGLLAQNNIFDRLEKCTTVYSMRDELEGIVKEFCKAKTIGTEKGQEFADKLEAYILEHYADCDLGGIMLENEFNKSYSYLSKVFKKYKMVGLLNYITDVRIKKSIELLKTTDYPISKIAQMVGYSNDRSFSRVFTKINGVAPGKYRE